MTENLTKKQKMLVDVMGNDDLLMEIMLRLPVESLYRFSCVSKRWHSLISSFISNSKFCYTHTQMNQKSSTFGVYFYVDRWERSFTGFKSISLRKAGQSLPTLEFLNLVNNAEPVILHASNGLFLCWIGGERHYAICNLTTQKFNILPENLPLSPFEYSDDQEFAYLDFHPEKSLHYKVVLVDWYYRDEKREGEYNELDGLWYVIDIYTSETNTWKRKHFRSSDASDFYYKALWNGAIHWMDDSAVHVRFEINTENLIANPLSPQPKIGDNFAIRYFGECCGRLFLIQIERHDCENFYILEMDDDFSWTVKYNVDMMHIRDYFDEIFQSPDPMGFLNTGLESWKFSVVCVVKEDENNDIGVLLALPGKIILLGRTTMKVLCEFPPTEFFVGPVYNYAVPFHFIPTLYPV